MQEANHSQLWHKAQVSFLAPGKQQRQELLGKAVGFFPASANEAVGPGEQVPARHVRKPLWASLARLLFTGELPDVGGFFFFFTVIARWPLPHILTKLKEATPCFVAEPRQQRRVLIAGPMVPSNFTIRPSDKPGREE